MFVIQSFMSLIMQVVLPSWWPSWWPLFPEITCPKNWCKICGCPCDVVSSDRLMSKQRNRKYSTPDQIRTCLKTGGVCISLTSFQKYVSQRCAYEYHAINTSWPETHLLVTPWLYKGNKRLVTHITPDKLGNNSCFKPRIWHQTRVTLK